MAHLGRDKRTMRHVSGKCVAACLVALALAACERPDAAAIARWKGSPEAEGKLAAVVKDGKVPAPVRGEAAAALVELGLGQQMQAAISGLDIGERALVIPAIVPYLARQLAGGDKGGDARDALFALREQATTQDARQALEQVLYPALVADARAGRERVGRYALLDMLVGIGAPTVPLLLPLLADPAVPFATPVAVIDKVGDGAAHEKGGDALVVRAKQQDPIPEPLWPALATLAGKQVSAFLIATVEQGHGPDVARAATAMAKMPPRTPGLSAFAVGKAADPRTPDDLRAQMFAVAEREHGEESRKALLALIADTKNDSKIRDRAFQAVVKASGGQVILEALEAFPPHARLTSAELRSEIVAPLSAMPGMDTRGPLFKAMQSKSPLARLVAILVLEKMGFKSDAGPLGKLVKDPGTVPGLAPEDQVGRAAVRAIATLTKSGF